MEAWSGLGAGRPRLLCCFPRPEQQLLGSRVVSGHGQNEGRISMQSEKRPQLQVLKYLVYFHTMV